VIPKLWELNGWTDEMPKLCHGAVETVDLDTLGNFINRIGRAGAPIDWATALPWMNDQAGIPSVSEGHDFSPRPLNGVEASDATPPGAKGEKS
jgi:phage gp29-like protein